jgi:hypothetical protein
MWAHSGVRGGRSQGRKEGRRTIDVNVNVIVNVNGEGRAEDVIVRAGHRDFRAKRKGQGLGYSSFSIHR